MVPALRAEDTPPASRSVTIDVVIASGPRDAAAGEMTPAALAELEKAGKLDWLTRTRLATIENDRASVQIGERTPLVVGRVARGGAGPFGEAGAQNMTTMVNVGATVEAIPRVLEDGSIAVNLSVERTWLEPTPAAGEAADSAPALSPAPTQRTGTINMKLTARVQPGEPTLVAAQSSSSGAGASQIWIVLTASAAANKPAAGDEAAAELKIFRLTFAKASDAAKLLEALLGKQPAKITADVRTNSVLVQAPPDTMDMVQAILTKVDVEQPKE